jgi:hypothetical protein
VFGKYGGDIEKQNTGLKIVNRLLAFVLVILGGIAFASQFSFLPIESSNMAIDWKHIWNGTHNLSANYGITELRTPPWSLIFIWPLTLFDMASSWALAAYGTLLILVLSVPTKSSRSMRLWATLVVISAYPAIRQLIDGNLEALIIGGVLLATYSLTQTNAFLFAISLLMLTAKIQETWLLLPFIAYWQLIYWPKKKRLRSYLIAVALALIPLAIFGQDWLSAMIHFPWPGTLIDSSLSATMARLSIPVAAYWLTWIATMAVLLFLIKQGRLQGNRSGFALLVTTALLLGPYAASNSLLTPFVLGVIPLFIKRPSWGLALASLYFFPYLKLGDELWRFNQESNYWTLVLILTFIVLAIDLWNSMPVSNEQTIEPAASN